MERRPSESPGAAPRPAWQRHATRIALIYGGFASLWILTSDRTVFHFLGDSQDIFWINVAKGIFFVGITSVLLWLLMRRVLTGLERSQFDLATREFEIRQSRTQLRALLIHLEQAREHERTRISREVHDVLGQLLTGIKMNLKWVTQRIPETAADRESLITKLDETDSYANAILASIQEIALDLRPGILDRLGLLPALRFETERFAKRTGIACQFQSELEDIGLPHDQATHVFRVVQEMLTNAARHAQASRIGVDVMKEETRIEIRVSDDGVGIPDDAENAPTSLGLLGMRERAFLLGGDVAIRRDATRGTRATLTFPDPRP